jgi:hypothetical protein
MDWTKFDELRNITGTTLSIHWPHGVASILTVVSQSELHLSPLFETHVRRLDNWTVGSALAAEFPFMNCVPTMIPTTDI